MNNSMSMSTCATRAAGGEGGGVRAAMVGLVRDMVLSGRFVGPEFAKLLCEVVAVLRGGEGDASCVLVSKLSAVAQVAGLSAVGLSGCSRVRCLGGPGGMLAVSVPSADVSAPVAGSEGRLALGLSVYTALLKIPIVVDGRDFRLYAKKLRSGRWVLLSRRDPSSLVDWRFLRSEYLCVPGGCGLVLSGAVIANMLAHVHLFPGVVETGGCYLRCVAPGDRLAVFSECGVSPTLAVVEAHLKSPGKAQLEWVDESTVHVRTCGAFPVSGLAKSVVVGGLRPMDHVKRVVREALVSMPVFSGSRSGGYLSAGGGDGSAVRDRTSFFLPSDDEVLPEDKEGVGDSDDGHSQDSGCFVKPSPARAVSFHGFSRPDVGFSGVMTKATLGSVIEDPLSVAVSASSLGKADFHGAGSCLASWARYMREGGPVTYPLCRELMGSRPPSVWPPGESGVSMVMGGGGVDASCSPVRWRRERSPLAGWSFETSDTFSRGKPGVLVPPAGGVYAKYEFWGEGMIELGGCVRTPAQRIVVWVHKALVVASCAKSVRVWRAWNDAGSCGVLDELLKMQSYCGDAIVLSKDVVVIGDPGGVVLGQPKPGPVAGTQVSQGSRLVKTAAEDIVVVSPFWPQHYGYRVQVSSPALRIVRLGSTMLRAERGVVSWIGGANVIFARVELSGCATVKFKVIAVVDKLKFATAAS